MSGVSQTLRQPLLSQPEAADPTHSPPSAESHISYTGSAHSDDGGSSAGFIDSGPDGSDTYRPGWRPLAIAAVITVCLLGLVTTAANLGLFGRMGNTYPEARKGAAVAVMTRSWGSNPLPRAALGTKSPLQSHHPPNRHLVVFSGKAPHSRSTVQNDLWRFDLASRTWARMYSYPLQSVQRSQGHPLPRWKQGSVRLKDDTMLVFGGDAMGIPKGGEAMRHLYLNDMWDLKEGKRHNALLWSAVEAQDDTNGTDGAKECKAPNPRRAMALTVFPGPNGSERLLMHGGRTRRDGLQTDVWINDLAFPKPCWTQVWPPKEGTAGNWASLVEPPSRKGHLAVSIPGREHPLVWVFGGRNDTKDGDPYHSDVWLFNTAKLTWREWTPHSGPTPLARDHLGGWYHNGQVYIYGGRGGLSYKGGHPLSDMWAFNLTSRTWRKLPQASGIDPGARFLYGMDTYFAASCEATSTSVQSLDEQMPIDASTTQDKTSDLNATVTAGERAKSDDDSAWYQVPNPDELSPDMRVVIFGGEAPEHCYLNDVLEYNVLKHEWTVLSGIVGSEHQRCSHHGHKGTPDSDTDPEDDAD